MPVSVGLQVLFRENIKKPAAGLQIFPWQINKILITGTRCLLMPQDAAFCAVSCGSVLSRASQNEIHHSAKRGKMQQIEAAKISRKVVKQKFSTTRIMRSSSACCQSSHMRSDPANQQSLQTVDSDQVILPYTKLPGQQKTGCFLSRSQTGYLLIPIDCSVIY